MVKQIGLDKEIDNLELLKAHLPYHESDHVLNIAYNVLLGGKQLEDIEPNPLPEGEGILGGGLNGYPAGG
jgi:hypothetical protein